MKQYVLAAFVAASAFATSGCATVLNGTNVDYATETRPEGATAKFTSGQECRTPCTLEMKRKTDQRVDLRAEGYKPTYVLIQSKLAGSSFGNILLGGGIGAVVDGTNGSSNRLYPRPLIVQLAREGTDEEAVLLDDEGTIIMTVDQHNDSVRVDVAKTIGPKLAGLED
jgi:hypothetical protein